MENIRKQEYEALEQCGLLASIMLICAGLVLAGIALQSLNMMGTGMDEFLKIFRLILVLVVLGLTVFMWKKLRRINHLPADLLIWGRKFPLQHNSFMEMALTHAIHISWMATMSTIIVFLMLMRVFSLTVAVLVPMSVPMIGAVMFISMGLAYIDKYIKENRCDAVEASDE